MAEKSFPFPDLGEGLIDATILEWLVKPGDRIERNDPLVEVETTKSALELPSPMSGVVKTLHGESGSVVKVGDPLVTFETPDAEAGIAARCPPRRPDPRVRSASRRTERGSGGRARRHPAARDRAGTHRRRGGPGGARVRVQRRGELAHRRMGARSPTPATGSSPSTCADTGRATVQPSPRRTG